MTVREPHAHRPPSSVELTLTTAPIRLSAAVMAHPKRAAAAHALAARFPELHVQVALDPEPDGPPSALRSARLAWAAVAPDATHHLVLQDDALPADNFLERLHSLIVAQPEAALSLFAEWGSRTSYAVRIAAMHGHHLAPVIDSYVPCQALVLPAETARGFDAYVEAKVDKSTEDDVALLHYLADRGISRLIPVANLADHDTDVSLVGNNVHGLRTSACLVPAHLAPLPAVPSVLTGLGTVPCYDFWGQYSDACIIDPASVDGRVRSSARVFLLEQGITEGEMATELQAALGRLPGRDFLTDRVSDIVLTEVWIVSYLLGFLAADLDGQRGASLDLTGPVASAALASLAPGAIRRIVPTRWLPAVGALLTPLVLDGVRAGMARVPVRG